MFVYVTYVFLSKGNIDILYVDVDFETSLEYVLFEIVFTLLCCTKFYETNINTDAHKLNLVKVIKYIF